MIPRLVFSCHNKGDICGLNVMSWKQWHCCHDVVGKWYGVGLVNQMSWVQSPPMPIV